MAIDTANKRGSALIDDCGIDFPPDGLIDTPDRAWLLGQYSGVAIILVSIPDAILQADARLAQIFSGARPRSTKVDARLTNILSPPLTS